MRRWRHPRRHRVRIRPLVCGEAGTVEAVFAGMSPESRQRRFHAPVRELSDRARSALADVDGTDRVALVAESRAGHGWRPVGIARLARENAEEAEVAIAVVDDHQRRGVARMLLMELQHVATELGISAFTGTIERENRAAIELLRGLFPQARIRSAGPVVRFRAPIDRDAGALTVGEVLADLGVPVAV